MSKNKSMLSNLMNGLINKTLKPFNLIYLKDDENDKNNDYFDLSYTKKEKPKKEGKKQKKKKGKKLKKEREKFQIETLILSKRVHRKYTSEIIDRIKKRCESGEIPYVDDGIKDTKPITFDELESYYKRLNIHKYVDIVRFSQHGAPTNQLQFDFENLLFKHKKAKLDVSNEKVINKINHAEINKKSFMNNITSVLRYINYFIEYYDDDDELIYDYFNMMFMIMERDIDLTPEIFIESLYATFTSPSLIEKINCLVEYNTDPNLVKKADKLYDESIQLTLDHLKAIIGVSCLHKIIIPIVSQYIAVKSNIIKKNGWTDKELQYQAFISFMPAFDDTYDVNLYNKLYHTATTRITKTTNQDSPMWDRRKNFGMSPILFTHSLIREYMVDISQKIICNSSGISYIHVCFDHAIKNELFQKDNYNFTEMTMEASNSVDEHFSRFDRYQIEKSFHSQRDRIRGFVSIQNMIYRLGLLFGIDFYKMISKNPNDILETKELRNEFEFYKNYLPRPLNESQLFIIQNYFGSKLDNMEDVNMIEFDDMIKIIMIMKRDFTSRNFIDLRFFISSRIDTSANRNYNKKKIEKLLKLNPCYDEWISEYGDNINMINFKKFYDLVKIIISCPMNVVDYEYKHFWYTNENNERIYQEKPTKMTDACIIDELLRLLISI